MLRNTLYLIISAIIAFSCSSNEGTKLPADMVTNPNTASGSNDLSDLPVIEFKVKEYNFGKVIQGEKVTYTFKFKNTGESDLIISQVNSSCGCTVPVFPKDPIKPGDEGKIKVSFDSSGRNGIQDKAITVVTNCQPNRTVLRIKAQVAKF
jgi:hypothetical protein